MRVVIQRVKHASVTINNQLHASISQGLMVLVGIEHQDSSEDVIWLANKVLNLRIFNDDSGVMNLSVIDIKGDILLVSQFTLHASTKKGNRPSYIQAATPEHAVPLYQAFLETLQLGLSKPIHSGVFGAEMQVSLVNDGPVTILIDSKNKV